MNKGIQELVKTAANFSKPNIRRLASQVKNPKQAGNVLSSWYKQHPSEKNMTYTNPSTGKSSTGNPYLKGFKSWANSGPVKKNKFGTMGMDNMSPADRKSLNKDMKAYGG